MSCGRVLRRTLASFCAAFVIAHISAWRVGSDRFKTSL